MLMSRLIPALFLGVLLPFVSARAADAPALPSFKELFSLIESNLAGVLPAELDQAAARGLLNELGGRVMLVTNTPSAATNTVLVARTNVFDSHYGYLRLGRMEDGLAAAFQAGLAALRATNELKGLVVDLRFAGGTNYAAAMAVADLFLEKAMPLLHVEETVLASSNKTDAIRLPTVILVNRRTAAAAEALAAVLRHHSAGLVIGGRTAGQAMIYREFTLGNGQRLRLAARYIRVADGMLLPSRGIKPDIEVETAEADERRYVDDAFANLTGTSENLAGRSRLINEAELVRRHREGQNPDAAPEPEVPAVKPAPPPQVRDPVLSRALDLLKGLSVVKKLQ
jgi:hypothetical protein